MLRKIWHKSNKEAGFSLVEILAVLAIIALLSVIGFKSYEAYAMQSRDKARLSDLQAMQIQLEQFYTAYGKYPCGDEVHAGGAPLGSFSDSISGPFIGLYDSDGDPWNEVRTAKPAWFTPSLAYWQSLWDSCGGTPMGGPSSYGYGAAATECDFLDPSNVPGFSIAGVFEIEKSLFYVYMTPPNRKSYLLYTNLEYRKDLEANDGGVSLNLFETGSAINTIPLVGPGTVYQGCFN